MGGDERSLGRHDNSTQQEANLPFRHCHEGAPANVDERTTGYSTRILAPEMTDEKVTPRHAWRPRRFMVVVGHPDDADFGPAGAAAAWIDAGAEGWLVCCTSGDAGGEDPNLDPA